MPPKLKGVQLMASANAMIDPLIGSIRTLTDPALIRSVIMPSDNLICAPMKYYWEIISDNLKKRGWSLGYSFAPTKN